MSCSQVEDHCNQIMHMSCGTTFFQTFHFGKYLVQDFWLYNVLLVLKLSRLSSVLLALVALSTICLRRLEAHYLWRTNRDQVINAG